MAAFATTSLPTVVPYRILFCIFVKHFISNLFSGSKNYVNKFYNLYQVIEFKVVLLIFNTSFWGGVGLSSSQYLMILGFLWVVTIFCCLNHFFAFSLNELWPHLIHVFELQQNNIIPKCDELFCVFKRFGLAKHFLILGQFKTGQCSSKNYWSYFLANLGKNILLIFQTSGHQPLCQVYRNHCLL